ncbi:hypothetical protein [Acanthopleuribacter pedis]|uniref:Uncharacterized protein n=1 Tax=Acanthopleuribacter pedis TaxID=442870 RepID=A0A8J7QLZ6_9BACT|nr:hypothetical protein [Acanthopleuribacter pedis]MBO1320425.1 hypothetical protein [Acanthopleuribacter pedis]
MTKKLLLTILLVGTGGLLAFAGEAVSQENQAKSSHITQVKSTQSTSKAQPLAVSLRKGYDTPANFRIAFYATITGGSGVYETEWTYTNGSTLYENDTYLKVYCRRDGFVYYKVRDKITGETVTKSLYTLCYGPANPL